MASPAPQTRASYGGEQGRDGKPLVIGLAALLLVVLAWKTWQWQTGAAELALLRPPARTLPAEPLLEGLDALRGAELAARESALIAAVDCCDHGRCAGVADAERVRQRPSLAYRDAVARLRSQARQRAGAGAAR